jgi:hypothetical protein
VLPAGLIWDDPSPREAVTRLTMDGEDDTHRDHHGAQHVYVGGGGGGVEHRHHAYADRCHPAAAKPNLPTPPRG